MLLKNFKLSISNAIFQFFSGTLLFLILARYISIKDFGLLSFILSVSGIISVINEFGFTLMSQRDLPQNRYDTKKFILNVLILKFILSLITISCLVLFYILFSNLNKNLILLGVIYGIATSFSSFLMGASRALNLFKVELLSSLIYLINTLLIVLHYTELKYILLVLIISRISQILYIILKILNVNDLINFNMDLTNLLKIYKESKHYAGHFIIGIIIFSLDIQILNFFGSKDQIGIYNAILKFSSIFILVGDLISNVALPYLSANFNKSFENKSSLIKKITSYASTILAFGFLFIFPLVDKYFFENKFMIEFNLLMLFSVSIFLRIKIIPITIFLTISGNQKARFIISSIILVISLINGVLLISNFELAGVILFYLSINLLTYFVYNFYYFKIKKIESIKLDIKYNIDKIIYGILLLIVLFILSNFLEINFVIYILFTMILLISFYRKLSIE